MLGYSEFKSLNEIYDKLYYIVANLYCSNFLLHKFFQSTFYTINFGLVWDLYKSVRNPFESIEQRIRIIFLLSPSYFLAIFVYWYFHELIGLKTFYEEDPICGDFRFDLMLAPGTSIVQVLYNVIAFAVVYLVGLSLCRKGLNK